MADGRVGVTNPIFSENDEDVTSAPYPYNAPPQLQSPGAVVPYLPMAVTPAPAPAYPLPPPAVQGTAVETQPFSQDPSGKTVLAMEHAAVNEIAVQNVQVAAAKVGNFNVAAMKNIEVKVQQKLQHRHELVETDQGLRLRRVTEVELRVYAHIFEDLYVEAIKEDPLALEEGGDPAVKATFSQRCTDICCQSCVCNFQSPFARQKENPFIHKKEVMTPILRRGRAQGWSIYSDEVFPLFSDIVRFIWVAAELTTVVFALIFSIVTFSGGRNRVFNIIHLLLTILTSFLAIADACYTLYTSCKACCAAKKTDSININANGGENPPDRQTNDATKNLDKPVEKSCQNKCFICCKEAVDVIRAFLVEALLYPLLICDIFEVITGRAYEGKNAIDRLSFTLFLISCFSILAYVYLARILILIGMIRAVKKNRKPFTDDPNVHSQYGFDPSIGRRALYLQVYFFVHVVLQMIAQVMMYVAIGGKIRYDNRHIYDTANVDTDDLPIYVSGNLWFMLVSGYILPFLGLLSFFVVTYYWIQEFPIGLCIDFIKLLKMPGPENFVKLIDTISGKEHMAEMLSKFVRLEKLQEQFKNMRATTCFEKFIYPFTSPFLVIFCLCYGILQFAFIMCAALTLNEVGQTVGQVLNGGGWVVYYIFAVIVGIVANLYVFAVAALWATIIVGVITLIVLVIAGFCLYVVLASMADNSSNRRRSYI